MPPQIGQIISDAVYDSQLGSNPYHTVTDKVIACRFINVLGTEKPNGTSYIVCLALPYIYYNIDVVFLESTGISGCSSTCSTPSGPEEIISNHHSI